MHTAPHPWRRLTASATAPSKNALASLTKALAKKDARSSLRVMRAGVKAAPTPELSARLNAALEFLDHCSVSTIQDADVQTLADAERLVERCTRGSLVDAVVVHRGLPKAVAMRANAERVQLDAGPGGWMTAVWLTDAPSRWRAGPLHCWDSLRHAVCAAESDAYEEAVAVADGLRAQVAAERLAYAFPDEPWAEQVLASEIAKPNPQLAEHACLLTACADAALLARVMKLPKVAGALADAAVDLAMVMPSNDVVPLFANALAELLVKPSYGPLLKTPPRRVAAALTVIGDEACAQVMAGFLGHKVLGPQAVSFFEGHPQHAAWAAERAPALTSRLEPSEGLDEVPPGQVPALLRDRSWRPLKRRSERVVSDLVWSRSIEVRFDGPQSPPLPDASPLTPEELAAWRAETRNRECDLITNYRRGGGTTYSQVPPEEGLAVWNAGKGMVHNELAWAHQHGVAALPGFLSGQWARWLDEDYGKERLDVLLGMHTPDVVSAFVDLFFRKRWRGTAERWLAGHVEIAGIALLPMALGPKGATRQRAEQVVTALARAGHSEALRQVAKVYGPEASCALDELLARRPQIPGKPPKPPDWLNPSVLPALRLADKALPADAVEALLELLSVDPSTHRFDVALALDPESVDDFVCALLALWVDHDAPGRHDWMMRAALVLPSPTAWHRLNGLARQWANNGRAKALRALGVLAEHADQRALMTLTHVAHSSRIAAVKAAAVDHLACIAAERGWSRDALDDRTVPDLGLDCRGGLVLDLGHRSVRAQVTSELEVRLTGEGETLRSLPRAGPDVGAHASAKKQLAALRKDVAAIRTRQCQRLELAMVTGRSWSLEEARGWLFEAPLLAGVVRALVWRCGGVAFRVAEDGSFANCDDEPVSVAGLVQVAHPLHLDVRLWAERLADYEQIQPFAQVSRDTYGDVAAVQRVGPVLGRKAMGRLESRGWIRQGGGSITGWTRGAAVLRAVPGIEVADLRYGDQAVHLEVVDTDGLDDVAASELLRDLQSFSIV